MENNLRRQDLIYPELSYKIAGCAYEVFNELGPGHEEKTYKNAMRIAFEKSGIKYECEKYIPIKFAGKLVNRKFADFLVEDLIVVELKATRIFSRSNINQTVGYLRSNEKKLALLINFGKDKVYIKRVPNLY
jgi:GxxExxY protein